MLSENITIIKHAFLQYIGNGVYHILFLIALICIFIDKSKLNRNDELDTNLIHQKNKKALLVGFPIVILLIILNPIFNKAIDALLNINVYWRTFWMVPMALVLAYLGVIVIKKVSTKTKKIILFILLVFIISLSGKFIYTQENYALYNNWYKIPDEYLEIINNIQDIEIDNKTVMVPTELIEYVRQVDASINLAYMRKSFDEYNLITIVKTYYSGDVEKFMKSCETENVNIIVHDKNIELSEPFENYGFELYKEMEKYDIYILK